MRRSAPARSCGSTVVVRHVQWRRGSVRLDMEHHGRPAAINVRQAIVTLPLGVLQAPATVPGAVRFSPVLTKDKAFAGLAVGPVIKIVLRFRTAFWEEVQQGKLCRAAFLLAPEQAFQTFWTTLPARTQLLTAWCGGPNAARLSDQTEAAITEQALADLAAIFSKRHLRDELLATYFHDWQRDPFARGAYSYVLAGGSRARQALARPLDNALFFAGEAADTQGESGTVAGALQSGRRAAQELITSH